MTHLVAEIDARDDGFESQWHNNLIICSQYSYNKLSGYTVEVDP